MDPAEAETFAISPDGRYFAAGYRDGIAVLYDSAGKQLAEFKSKAENARAIAFSANGRLLATGGYDGTLKLWDTASQREILTLRGTPYPVRSIVFSHDETKLASLDVYMYLRVWHAPIDAGAATESKPVVTASSRSTPFGMRKFAGTAWSNIGRMAKIQSSDYVLRRQ